MSKSGETIKIGVYVCRWGVNIGAAVDCDAVREAIEHEPDVTISRTNDFTCSDPGQNIIKNDILELENLTRSKFIKSKQFKYLKYTVFCKNNFYCLKCFKIGIKELRKNEVQITNENYNNFILSIKLKNLNNLKLHLYNKHEEFNCDILYENMCNISYLLDSVNINYSSNLFLDFYNKNKK